MPKATGKFKPGNIVRFKGAPETTALSGSVAIVYGYSPSEYLNVFWLNNLAGAQSNGGYHESDFELMYETPASYRPDIKPEDRGLTPESYGGQRVIGRLEGAVTAARAAGHTVKCSVSTQAFREL